MIRKKGFTLLELMVVIIIIGVLATLGVTQYGRVIEKSRTSEAKTLLGTLRTAQIAYELENGSYATIGDLPVNVPTVGPTCTDNEHYFYYSTDATTGKSTADRCTAGGKSPPGSACDVTLTIAGGWGGSCP